MPGETEVQILQDVCRILGISEEEYSGQTEVPLLRQIRTGIALLVESGGGGGAVSSVFGRTGAVVAANGDYSIGQITGAGTMAAQNANAVAITGGTIDGTVIGGGTPAAGMFTAVTTQEGSNFGAYFFSNQWFNTANNGGYISLNNSSDASIVLTTRGNAGGQNTVDQRNGTNPQAFNIYNTFTDASNYERGFLKLDTNIFCVGTDSAGTGNDIPIELQSGGVAQLRLASGLVFWPSLAVNADAALVSTHSVVFNINGSDYRVMLAEPV